MKVLHFLVCTLFEVTKFMIENTMYINENTDGAIKNGQFRETDQHRAHEEKHKTICVGHHYHAQTTTNNINKT